MKIKLKPIAYVQNSRLKIEDDNWGEVISEIVLTDDLPASSLDEIEKFSHLEIIYYFHKVKKGEIIISSENPRENKKYPKVGIFAQRKKSRPNLLGASIVELIKKEEKRLIVKNLDAINGTPVLDIKPVFIEYLPKKKIKQPNWVKVMMKDYW